MDHHSSGGRQHGSPEMKSKIADQILAVMNLSGADVLADVGSGDGYYSSRFADNCGKVVAIDAHCDGLKGSFYARPNIETVCGDACRWFKENSPDKFTHIFFSNSFHDMSCQDDILSALSGTLTKGAHLDLIEFHPETPFGPPKSIRFSKDALRSKVERFGFKQETFIELNTHYFSSFRKA